MTTMAQQRTEARARLYSDAADRIEAMAWDLQDQMQDALPAQVADALRDELRDSGEFSDEEIDAAREIAFHAVVNG